jgi:hypothetical protein
MLPQAGALLICRISRQINKDKTLSVLSAFVYPACPVERSLYVQPGLNEVSSSVAYLTGAVQAFSLKGALVPAPLAVALLKLTCPALGHELLSARTHGRGQTEWSPLRRMDKQRGIRT